MNMETTRRSYTPYELHRIIFFLSFLIMSVCTVYAQENQPADSLSYFIEDLDGNEYIGIIEFEDDQIIRLRTKNLGTITIQKSNVRQRRRLDVSKIVDGKYWAENLQETRYFWQPSGYGLKKGEGYYQNVWILFNQFSVGIMDNFSVGAGLVPVFLFGGDVTPVWANLKLSVPIKENKFNVGVGGLFGTVFGESNSGFGILYGLTTFGSRDKNMSIGLGWGYTEGDFATKPTVTFSAMIRGGRKWYFLTENYFISSGDESVGILSVGGRSMVKRVGIDYGLFVPIAAGSIEVAIPWLGLTAPFGK